MKLITITYLILVCVSNAKEIIAIEVEKRSGFYEGGFCCYLSKTGDLGVSNTVYESEGKIAHLVYTMEDDLGHDWRHINKELISDEIIDKLNALDFKKETAPAGSVPLRLKIIYSDHSSATFKSYNNQSIRKIYLYISKIGWLTAKKYVPLISYKEDPPNLTTIIYPKLKRKKIRLETIQP